MTIRHTKKPLPQTQFAVTKLDNDWTKSVGDPVTYTTGEQATDALHPLAPGKYEIHESVSPSGYQKDQKSYYIELRQNLQTGDEGATAEWFQYDSDKKTTTPVSANDPQDTGFYVEADTPNILHFKQFDKPATWSLNLHKQATDTDEPLAGATFQLTSVTSPSDSDGATSSPELSSSSSSSNASSSDANDSVKATNDALITDNKGALPTQTGLKLGQLYRLTETDAPAGYQKLKEPIYLKDGVLVDDKGDKLTTDPKNVSIKTDSPDTSYTLTVKDDPERILPHTGGLGPRDYLVFALCMLGAAICLLLLVKLKRQEVSDHD
ncbi:prealbumin-like fold domain-containing protein [Lacticaseibacillus jixianensis]|uniref:Prealbumin-like fold domain-containing protein n=1 Tax=Lacticaseibacillus jixianensis TaxID=2486012 RepID=A0ABW4BCG0_9LACO